MHLVAHKTKFKKTAMQMERARGNKELVELRHGDSF
jgi:hypothetical protein